MMMYRWSDDDVTTKSRWCNDGITMSRLQYIPRELHRYFARTRNSRDNRTHNGYRAKSFILNIHSVYLFILRASHSNHEIINHGDLSIWCEKIITLNNSDKQGSHDIFNFMSDVIHQLNRENCFARNCNLSIKPWETLSRETVIRQLNRKKPFRKKL